MKAKKELEKEIITLLEFVPGIAGFESIVEEGKKNQNYIIIENNKTNKDLDISLGIIIDKNVLSETITKEIISALKFFFKKSQYNLGKLKIYIKGVK